MRSDLLHKLLLLLSTLLILQPFPATAESPVWNQPGREPGYDESGLLRINKDFFNLSAATGGDFYYWAPGEFAEAAGRLNVPVASDPIALAYASKGGPFTRTLNIPVDSTISLLSLFAGAQRLDELGLLRPDGRSVAANPAGASEQKYRHMRILTLTDPEPGLWQVTLHGAGSFEIAVRYLTDRIRLAAGALEGIDLVDFDFVELSGRPGHQGLFPVSGQPQAGTVQRCRMTLTGSLGPPTIKLVSATGAVLGEVRLEEQSEAATDEFICSCRVPDQPFRVMVQGRDPQNWPFQRLTSGLITPERVSVKDTKLRSHP